MIRFCRLVFIAMCVALLTANTRAAPLPAPRLVHSERPYLIEEVRVASGHVILAATLLMPLTEAPVPAVIIIPGSGPATRNGSWNMYRHIGEYLVQRGIAVLSYDKRGVGGSTGNWQTETFAERAQDVTVLLAYLKNRSDIDPSHLGLIGHSQGAYIAPLVAADSSEVAFVTLLAGSGQTVWDQILTNERAEAEGNGLSASDIEKQIGTLTGQLELARQFAGPCRALAAHYLCFVLDYDPAPALSQLTVPTLALYAELDTQVPPTINIPLVQAALETAGNRDYTFRTFPSANHWFALAATGTTAEMRALTQSGQIDHYDFAPQFLETIGDWIEAQVVIEAVP